MEDPNITNTQNQPSGVVGAPPINPCDEMDWDPSLPEPESEEDKEVQEEEEGILPEHSGEPKLPIYIPETDGIVQITLPSRGNQAVWNTWLVKESIIATHGLHILAKVFHNAIVIPVPKAIAAGMHITQDSQAPQVAFHAPDNLLNNYRDYVVVIPFSGLTRSSTSRIATTSNSAAAFPYLRFMGMSGRQSSWGMDSQGHFLSSQCFNMARYLNSAPDTPIILNRKVLSPKMVLTITKTLVSALEAQDAISGIHSEEDSNAA